MKSSDFSARELFFCTSRSERRNLSLSLESFSTEFESQLKSLSNGSFDFSIGKKENIFFNSNQDKYDYLFQKLVLRKIYRNIESKYKFTHPNRDVIISQICIKDFFYMLWFQITLCIFPSHLVFGIYK